MLYGVVVGILLIGLAFVAVEVALRWRFGLGNPPLYMKDDEIEYLMQPGRRYRRKGRLMRINNWSMRSDDLDRCKAQPSERRVLVLGDSVVFGGQGVDQAKIATSLLQTALRERLAASIIVGNASAASWGPPNLLAYVKRYGTFDADVILVVMSSHDYGDVPAAKSTVGVITRPDRKPLCALHELAQMLLSKRRKMARARRGEVTPPPMAAEIEWALRDYRELLRKLNATGATVLAALHPEQSELNGDWLAGHADLAEIIEQEGIERIDWTASFAASRDAGAAPHGDVIHPNATGQRLMFEAMLPRVEAALLSSRATASS